MVNPKKLRSSTVFFCQTPGVGAAFQADGRPNGTAEGWTPMAMVDV